MRDTISNPQSAADRLARTVRIIALALAAVLVAWVLGGFLLLIFLAILLAVVLRGVSDWVAQHTRAPAGLALAATAIVFVAALLGFFVYLGPRFAGQAQDIWAQLSQTIQTLRHSYDGTSVGHIVLDHLQQALTSAEGNFTSYATAVATTTLHSLTQAVVVVVTALYLAATPAIYRRGLLRLLPLHQRDRAHRVLFDLTRILRWWVLGQLIDMTVVGVLSCIGLTVLGVPLPIGLGVLAGLLTFIPYLGALAAAIPAMLVALTVSGQATLWTAGIFLLCHIIEGYVVSPLVQRRTVHMPPAVSILSMTILGGLMGMLGVILGTPLAAVGLTVVREVYVGQVLGDPDIPAPGGQLLVGRGAPVRGSAEARSGQTRGGPPPGHQGRPA